MRREDLAHILRAAARIIDRPMLVIGSQAIHGGIDDVVLPELTMLSREVDIAFWDDPDDALADRLDAAIGELSGFDQSFGYYAQGVGLSTAILPTGWEGRVVRFESVLAGGAQADCLEPHDLALSKLAAQREKDVMFVTALIDADLLDIGVLLERVETLPVSGVVRANIRRWLISARDRRRGGPARPF